MIEFACPQCGSNTSKPTGAVNRSLKKGAPVYCGKECAGLARRSNKSVEEKKALKAAYDREYRANNREILKRKKRDYFQQTYDPVEAKVNRDQLRTPEYKAKHAAMCRRPDQRAKARVNYHKRKFGEYAGASLVLQDLINQIRTLQPKRETDLVLGRVGKSTRRKRDYERSISNKSEIGALGNLAEGQVR